MIEQDTIRLLRECDSGVKMGISSIDDVIDNVTSKELKCFLSKSKEKHSELSKEIDALLSKYHDEGKEPGPMLKGMSWIKTNVKLAVDYSDNTIADLMTDGCNMGIKSLSKYLNEYAAADEKSKDITKKLIKIEEDLSNQLRDYL
ncbi:MAG: hypothetical protein E7315_01995 [Clostridiales bacterium]|nr:hypothetical protein [Clostridiales bacterium]